MVYLVDDDHDDLELVQEALFDHSYKGPVLKMNNGKKLIDQLHNNPSPKPQVIILDLNMPVLDGFETLDRIRKDPVYAATPVIVFTASSKKEDEKRSLDLGCNFFLTKPSKVSDYATLTMLVKNFISSSQG